MKLHHIEVHKTKKGTFVALWIQQSWFWRWWTGREADLVILKQGKGFSFSIDAGPLNDWKSGVAAQAALAVLRKPCRDEPYKLRITQQPFMEESDYENRWPKPPRPVHPNEISATDLNPT